MPGQVPKKAIAENGEVQNQNFLRRRSNILSTAASVLAINILYVQQQVKEFFKMTPSCKWPIMKFKFTSF